MSGSMADGEVVGKYRLTTCPSGLTRNCTFAGPCAHVCCAHVCCAHVCLRVCRECVFTPEKVHMMNRRTQSWPRTWNCLSTKPTCIRPAKRRDPPPGIGLRYANACPSKRLKERISQRRRSTLAKFHLMSVVSPMNSPFCSLRMRYTCGTGAHHVRASAQFHEWCRRSRRLARMHVISASSRMTPA